MGSKVPVMVDIRRVGILGSGIMGAGLAEVAAKAGYDVIVRSRTKAAAERLFGLLPAATGTRLRELWEEYERGDTPEARYVMGVDRVAPMLLNLAEGGSTWREHGITRQRVIARNGPHVQPALPAVWAAALARLDAATAAGAVMGDDEGDGAVCDTAAGAAADVADAPGADVAGDG